MSPDPQNLASFICEACTVRSMMDRELTGPKDWKLMCFERIRILDMVHYWSSGTVELVREALTGTFPAIGEVFWSIPT